MKYKKKNGIWQLEDAMAESYESFEDVLKFIHSKVRERFEKKFVPIKPSDVPEGSLATTYSMRLWLGVVDKFLQETDITGPIADGTAIFLISQFNDMAERAWNDAADEWIINNLSNTKNGTED